MLDATEINAKGNGKFAVDVDHVEKKCGRCKKKESNLFLFYATSLQVTFAGNTLYS